MNKIIHIDSNCIFGATTLKVLSNPEKNNTALHVCINPDDVMINRKTLSKDINVPLENWCLPWQKHTANLCQVYKKDRKRGAFDKDTSIMNVDGLYTTDRNVLIGVFTADCVGLLLVDETTPCIATIHSGWKGTVQAITMKGVNELIEKGLMHPESIKAYFSPSILFDSLEVGMEVVEQVKTLPFDVEPFIRYMPNEKAYIDNQGLNIQMLRNAGVLEENIFPSTLDTKKELECCFSYRNEKKTGEHFTFGYIK
ncbi:MAG: laccase domain-containing protein [Holdemanella sp.]|nr:laccase domain-containing protein [Holdemanella sp.]